jgi:ribokinase
VTGPDSRGNHIRPVVVVGAHVQGLLLDVDGVPREGETVLASSFDEPVDGGKSTNQAVAAARLGAPTALVTVVGSDERGRRALDFFAAQGIDVSGCVEVHGATDVGVILLPPSKVPAIVTVLDRNRDLDAACVARAAEIIRSGSLVLCALEAPQAAALAAFELAADAGVCTLLNPAPAARIAPALLAVTDVLVPNEHEAAILVGTGGAPPELARVLADELPVEAVVVTAGSAGAYVAGAVEGAVEHVPAPEVEVVDTTGAGDAFIGALASRLQLGVPLLDAVAFGVEAASVSITRPGTMLAFPTSEELAGALEVQRG